MSWKEHNVATSEEKKPKVKLVGADGNAFAILAKCRLAAKQAKWTPEKLDEFTKKAMEGDYDALLRTCTEYFDVR